MPKGGRRDNAGRPPGARNKRTLETVAKAEASGLMPLDYMLSVLRNEAEPTDRRQWAAQQAAPYVHARLSHVDANHQGKMTQKVTFEWTPPGEGDED